MARSAMPDACFETSRTIVRDWRQSDLEHLIALRTNPRVMAHFPGTDSPEKIASYFPQMCQRSTERGYGFRPVFEKSTKQFMGFCGVTDVNFETHFTPAIEIGWSFLPDYWGKGLATETATAWLNFAFTGLQMSEIFAFAVLQNTKSHAVMKRLGMQRDNKKDFIHPKVTDAYPHLKRHIVYSITKETWLKQKKG